MVLNALIQRFRQRRKASYLAMSSQFGDEFAFVGVGMHSIQNLYPVLQHLGIPLRWIHSRTLSNAAAMAQRFSGARATDNLNLILQDEKVKHVFICSHPSIQHSIVLKCVQAGKNVWVEKPIAKTEVELEEIVQIQKQNSVLVVAGHQKRFAPCYQKLKNSMRNPKTYVLNYTVGAYPEGDLLSEVFIHPIDLAVHLFGAVKSIQATGKGNKGEQTIFAILRHENGAIGNLELTSCGDWRQASETLKVDCEAGIYHSENFRNLRFRPRRQKIFGVPQEKFLDSAIEGKILFSANGFLPELNQNEIYLAGYYDSILQFSTAVSSRNKFIEAQAKDLFASFNLLDRLREIVNQ